MPKTVYLILFLIFLIILIILFKVMGSGDQPASKAVTPTPPFTITNTSLTDQPVGVTEFIKINFSRAVLPEQLAVEVTPPTEVEYLPDTPRQISIAPKNAWNFDKAYTIKVLRTTRSKGGQFLDKDYEFTFKTIIRSGI